MAANKYLAHLQVLVEDDANRQLINGLNQDPSLNTRKLHLLNPAGGWKFVLDYITDQHVIQGMINCPMRHLLLLIDFDNKYLDRWALYQQNKAALPQGVSRRIYLLGCLHEPETLKAAFHNRKSLEELGRELSEDCSPPPDFNLWQHPHLQHNAPELNRLLANVEPFLFHL